MRPTDSALRAAGRLSVKVATPPASAHRKTGSAAAFDLALAIVVIRRS
jgi:hypothetical protein